jgi:hypothetical protein
MNSWPFDEIRPSNGTAQRDADRAELTLDLVPGLTGNRNCSSGCTAWTAWTKRS